MTGTSYVVPAGVLQPGQKYRWNLQALNSAGASPVSNTLYFHTAAPPAAAPFPITLTLYVHDGSATGPVLTGARVTGQDGGGKTFDQTTNASGTVTLTGAPGTWQFTASKSGWRSNSWSQAITASGTKHAFLFK